MELNPQYANGPLREYGLPFAVVLMSVTLPLWFIIGFYLIMGQAHFLMTYLYQYRGKRMTFWYLAVAVLLLLGTYGYFFMTDFGYVPLLLVASFLFGIHFAIDEYTLHGEKISAHAWPAIIGYGILFTTIVAQVVSPELVWLTYLAYGLIPVTILCRLILSRLSLLATERYLLYTSVLMLILGVVLHFPHQVLGLLLILHFMNWYVGYGVRVRAVPEKARRYWREVILSLALVGSLFLLSIVAYGTWAYILFGLTPYYAWAIAHILLSFVSALEPRRS